jgi:hypothetical protein
MEGFWLAQFQTAQDAGAGVVVFFKGEVFGGDSRYYYLGTYEEKNGKVSGKIEVTHFSGPPSSVFGNQKRLRLQVSGIYSGPKMILDGHLTNDPNQTIKIHLTKRENLP